MDQSSIVDIFSKKIREYRGKPLRIMEVCGTHTHENFRLGIRSLLPKSIRLISGPGCPVCVTPSSYIDEAIEIAANGAMVCSFGDLLRVPGAHGTLLGVKALGAQIRIVYSPLDALEIAKENPSREVVFLSVGFETTTPISCLAVEKAYEDSVANFSLLTANKTMTNVYEKLSEGIDAFLYPGHVSAVVGTCIYKELKSRGISGVVTGFTASEILAALAVIIENGAKNIPFYYNCYTRVVDKDGNKTARKIIDKVMEPCDSVWRGIGNIANSGLRLRKKYERLDARKKYGITKIDSSEPNGCRCGDVLRGKLEPWECPLYKKSCTPENPCGACMVSSEGACAAYYKYGTH